MWQSMDDCSEVSPCFIEKSLHEIENRFSHSPVCSNLDNNMETEEFQDDFVEVENKNLEILNTYDNDVSMYDNNGTCSQPEEEFDLNCRYSGFDSNLQTKEEKITFLQPEDNMECRRSFCRYYSSRSVESADDSFQNTNYIESEENNCLPLNLHSIVNGPIKNQTPVNTYRSRVPSFLRRNISLMEENIKLNYDDISSPKQCENNVMTSPNVRRSSSDNQSFIMSALQRSSNNPDLIGDFSKPFCLPFVPGRHQDLKSISPTILAYLLQGKYENTVSSFKVIDCRYPYEFEGGHIIGAFNYYAKEQIMFELVEKKTISSKNSKRDILVFHCEFSSERGPNLSRFLRNVDRTRNNNLYPALDWPEIYLLDGGYKNFYEHYSELCVPVAYTPMLDAAHANDLKYFRSSTNNCNIAPRKRYSLRSSKIKRLNFV